MRSILCTGGLGYIGSHVVVALANSGYHVTIFDDCSSSHPSIFLNIKHSTKCPNSVMFSCIDIGNASGIDSLFKSRKFDLVIHCAGLRSGSESIIEPLRYYEQNVANTVSLLKAMHKHNCKKLVFSSSASIYAPCPAPVTETFPVAPSSPYSATKVVVEDLLKSLQYADSEWAIICLRYFNPVGAHASGHLTDKPDGPNVVSSFLRALKTEKPLLVFGSDYSTPDGTAVRDFIHIDDLASGHLCATDFLLSRTNVYECINLGTDNGNSVLEIIKTFEDILGKPVKYELLGRRPGDNAVIIADSRKARKLFGWKPKRSLSEAVESALVGFRNAKAPVSYTDI